MTQYTEQDTLHKKYELRETGRTVMPGLPVIVRLDGRAFHSFTRGMERPFDRSFVYAMKTTTETLVEETHASIGYTQSDEISLAFANDDPNAEFMFGGRFQKLCSIFAALATAAFNREVTRLMPQFSGRLPHFDCRVWQYPSKELAADHFLWREQDACKNSLQMACQALYSPKALHGNGTKMQHELLHAKGINWNNYPAMFKRGTIVKRTRVERFFTEDELSFIPINKRPTGPIMRGQTIELEMGFREMGNLADVVFNKDAKLIKREREVDEASA